MSQIPDRPWDEFIDLPNGKKALVEYTWKDKQGRIADQAEVFVEDDLSIGKIKGPLHQDEIDAMASEMAVNWYRNRED